MLCSGRGPVVGELGTTLPPNHLSSDSTNSEDYVRHTCPGAGVSFQEPLGPNDEDNELGAHEFIVDQIWYMQDCESIKNNARMCTNNNNKWYPPDGAVGQDIDPE